VSVTALTAPLELLPLDELDRGLRELADRFEVAAVRLRDRDLAAAEDRWFDLEPDDDDDRLAAPALLPEPALRLLAGVERPLDERDCEATGGTLLLRGVQALYPGHVFAHAGWSRAADCAESTQPTGRRCVGTHRRPPSGR
jgi:hypothetical protein